jgi:hypothetical protein
MVARSNGDTAMKRLAVMLIGAMTVVLTAQTSDLLDLTQPRGDSRRFTTEPVTVSGAGISSHARREQSSVRLNLDWFDRETYSDGESFVFHVTLENVGRNAVAFPWEPDSSRVATTPDAAILKAVLTIEIDTRNPRLIVPIATLYGSSLTPNDTKVLQPGARAEIIAKGQWAFMGHEISELAQMHLPPELNVTARIGFMTSINGHLYDALKSNKVVIRLERRSGF